MECMDGWVDRCDIGARPCRRRYARPPPRRRQIQPGRRAEGDKGWGKRPAAERMSESVRRIGPGPTGRSAGGGDGGGSVAALVSADAGGGGGLCATNLPSIVRELLRNLSSSLLF